MQVLLRSADSALLRVRLQEAAKAARRLGVDTDGALLEIAGRTFDMQGGKATILDPKDSSFKVSNTSASKLRQLQGQIESVKTILQNVAALPRDEVKVKGRLERDAKDILARLELKHGELMAAEFKKGGRVVNSPAGQQLLAIVAAASEVLRTLKAPAKVYPAQYLTDTDQSGSVITAAYIRIDNLRTENGDTLKVYYIVIKPVPSGFGFGSAEKLDLPSHIRVIGRSIRKSNEVESAIKLLLDSENVAVDTRGRAIPLEDPVSALPKHLVESAEVDEHNLVLSVVFTKKVDSPEKAHKAGMLLVAALQKAVFAEKPRNKDIITSNPKKVGSRWTATFKWLRRPNGPVMHDFRSFNNNMTQLGFDSRSIQSMYDALENASLTSPANGIAQALARATARRRHSR